jgi:hypothetical protein
MKYDTDFHCDSDSGMLANIITRALTLATCLTLAFGISHSASAQDSPLADDRDEPTIQVLSLGTFHFAQAPDFHDLMAPEQQAEIQAVVDSLAAFEPTKVVVEWPFDQAATFDSLYDAYRNGRHELSVNERQQLGMRLADQRGHDDIFAIDHKQPWGMQEVMEWAQENDPSFIEYFQAWKERSNATDDRLHRTKTIGEILHHRNQPETLAQLQHARMRMLEVGAGSSNVGVKPVTSVHDRNFKIFANLLSIAEPGDRIVIIYGAGHSYFFRTLTQQHPDLQFVNPLDYL